MLLENWRLPSNRPELSALPAFPYDPPTDPPTSLLSRPTIWPSLPLPVEPSLRKWTRFPAISQGMPYELPVPYSRHYSADFSVYSKWSYGPGCSSSSSRRRPIQAMNLHWHVIRHITNFSALYSVEYLHTTKTSTVIDSHCFKQLTKTCCMYQWKVKSFSNLMPLTSTWICDLRSEASSESICALFFLASILDHNSNPTRLLIDQQ